MHAPGSEGRKTHQITGAFAPDGEYLPFLAALVPEGGPEVWLNAVETAMFAAVKRHLFKVSLAMLPVLAHLEPLLSLEKHGHYGSMLRAVLLYFIEC